MADGEQLFENLKQNVESYSSRQKDIARLILANYQKVAFKTIREFARMARTSEATIIRFVKILGFSGYPAFQREIRRLVRKDLKGHERFKLASESKERNTLSRFLDKEFENLSFLNKTFDERTFLKAVHAISGASEVVVMGTRSAVGIVYHLWFGLHKIGIKVRKFTTISTETYDEINFMDSHTLVIIIGFPRYLRELVVFLKLLQERKIKTLTITDSPFSPLRGDISLFCPAESGSYMAFHAAPLLLMNLLLDAVGVNDKLATVDALDRFEKLAERKGYFIKT